MSHGFSKRRAGALVDGTTETLMDIVQAALEETKGSVALFTVAEATCFLFCGCWNFSCFGVCCVVPADLA